MSLTDMTTQDVAWLEKVYNNRALVPEHVEIFARWRATSAEARRTQRCFLDIAFGQGPNESLDVFVPAQSQPSDKRPVMVFIHGGYWRSLDKADHSFVAPAFTQEGAIVVMPNYALCPAVTIPEITMQMVRAMAWTRRNIARFGGDPERVVVVGHSAGGHLATMMLSTVWPSFSPDLPAHWVQHAVSISGLYELESVRITPFLADLRLTPSDALRASPAWMPAPAAGALQTYVGGLESEAFLHHNQMMQAAWGAQRVPVCETLPGLNHFTVVDALTQPNHRLHQAVQRLLA